MPYQIAEEVDQEIKDLVDKMAYSLSSHIGNRFYVLDFTRQVLSTGHWVGRLIYMTEPDQPMIGVMLEGHDSTVDSCQRIKLPDLRKRMGTRTITDTIRGRTIIQIELDGPGFGRDL
jgi:hypothetical protein